LRWKDLDLRRKSASAQVLKSRTHPSPFACLNFEFRQRSLKGLREPLHPPTHHYRQKCKGCFGSKKPFSASSSHSPMVLERFVRTSRPPTPIYRQKCKGCFGSKKPFGQSSSHSPKVPKSFSEHLHPLHPHYRQKCKGCFGSQKPFRI